jgi:hypothetical protein
MPGDDEVIEADADDVRETLVEDEPGGVEGTEERKVEAVGTGEFVVDTVPNEVESVDRDTVVGVDETPKMTGDDMRVDSVGAGGGVNAYVD